MRFLIDASLSPRVGQFLEQAGHEAVHVSDLGLGTADDQDVLSAALEMNGVLVTADADFGTLLALASGSRPSVILLRSADHLTPNGQGELLAANLASITEELESGALVSLTHGRLRVRPLPIRGRRPS